MCLHAFFTASRQITLLMRGSVQYHPAPGRKAHCPNEVKLKKKEPTSWKHHAQLGCTARHCLHVLAPLEVQTFEPAKVQIFFTDEGQFINGVSVVMYSLRIYSENADS